MAFEEALTTGDMLERELEGAITGPKPAPEPFLDGLWVSTDIIGVGTLTPSEETGLSVEASGVTGVTGSIDVESHFWTERMGLGLTGAVSAIGSIDVESHPLTERTDLGLPIVIGLGSASCTDDISIVTTPARTRMPHCVSFSECNEST